MDRAEATGLGVALAGHGALLAVLTLGFASVRQPPLMSEPMEVSFVEELAVRSAAPQPATQAPAPSAAPELGAPEQAAPAPAPPQPVPPLPKVEPVPPPPQPEPVPKAVLTPPPAPAPKPAQPTARPKPAPVTPAQPKAAPAKAAPARPAPAAPAATPARPPKAGTAKAAPARPVPATPAAPGAWKGPADTGRRLNRNILDGVGSDPAAAEATPAPAAAISPIQLAGIRSAIQRQIQPCADRQVNPGPGASEIQVTLNLRLRPDGSLAANPTVVRTSGVTGENSRYEKRVADLAIAAYSGCAPLRGLPDELYRTANGGWSNINMNYKLPG
jgi:hypothetical protein